MCYYFNANPQINKLYQSEKKSNFTYFILKFFKQKLFSKG